jgi:alkylation response protein AidB-like acyl-CoA dehydrogenase
MNLALSDEQVLLREAARDALSRHKTLEAARDALDGEAELPDLWGSAMDAGWPGLLVAETHGGAGLGAFDAMLVLQECGRVLASLPLLGHLPASAILNEGSLDDELLQDLAAGQRRAVYLPAKPGDEVEHEWTVDPRSGQARGPLPAATEAGSRDGTRAGEQVEVSGTVHFVPDAPGADVLVGAASLDEQVVAVVLDATSEGVSIEPVRRYDATRSLGHVQLDHARGTLLDAGASSLAVAWHLTQALIAAESIGAVETALEVSVAYAKERYTFGRAIGSYQAVKHALTEVLRRLENGRSLLYYAGWAHEGGPDEFPLAANAARSVAGAALDNAARTMISVHGGIGATWEHDAPLFFRRAQLSRRLLGGTSGATDRVANELLS